MERNVWTGLIWNFQKSGLISRKKLNWWYHTCMAYICTYLYTQNVEKTNGLQPFSVHIHTWLWYRMMGTRIFGIVHFLNQYVELLFPCIWKWFHLRVVSKLLLYNIHPWLLKRLTRKFLHKAENREKSSLILYKKN